MKKRRKVIVFAVLLFSGARFVHAVDFWQYPEMAEKHSIFAGVFGASFSALYDNYFKFRPEIDVDYLLPAGLPFSAGIALRTFDDNLFAAGLRAGYHINLGEKDTDLYGIFTADLVFQNEFVILEYGGRLGIRRRFGRFFCLHAESGFKFQSLNVGLSVKLN